MFLELDSIDKSYGDLRVLEKVSLAVHKGELVSLIGPSGAGKTTLLKIIAGLESADDGAVTSAADLKNNPAILVFQDYLLFPTMTVFDNVAFGLRCRKEKKEDIGAKVAAMLDYFQLGDKTASYPNQLSAGQQQRVALARAMVVSPSLLLLDEPFANLDRNLKAETAEFIRGFQQEYGITTLSVTHDLQEAFMMSDKIGILLNGRLCQYDDVKAVYNRPVSSQVADFLGHVNSIPSAAFALMGINGGVRTGVSAINVRAESIVLTKDSNGPGSIKEMVFAGQYIIYRVLLQDTRLTVYSFDSDLEEGDRVSLTVKHYISIKEN